MTGRTRHDQQTPLEPREDEQGMDLVELVLEDHARRAAPPPRIDGVVVGRVVAISDAGTTLVEYDDWPGAPLEARAVVITSPADVGRSCALVFEGGRPDRPILMGFMFDPSPPEREPAPAGEASSPEPPPQPTPGPVVERNGERLVFEAGQEIVLKCGKASITLTRAGKILIRGAYVLTRSSGVNRIQGGSVQIN